MTIDWGMTTTFTVILNTSAVILRSEATSHRHSEERSDLSPSFWGAKRRENLIEIVQAKVRLLRRFAPHNDVSSGRGAKRRQLDDSHVFFIIFKLENQIFPVLILLFCSSIVLKYILGNTRVCTFVAKLPRLMLLVENSRFLFDWVLFVVLLPIA